jgi:hypothetical protein
MHSCMALPFKFCAGRLTWEANFECKQRRDAAGAPEWSGKWSKTMKMDFAVFQKLSDAEQKAYVETLQAAAEKRNNISFKVSEKGGVSVYGLNARFPVTLYLNQWLRLIDSLPQMKAFIEANKASIKTEKTAS